LGLQIFYRKIKPGETLVYVVVDEVVSGFIALADRYGPNPLKHKKPSPKIRKNNVADRGQ